MKEEEIDELATELRHSNKVEFKIGDNRVVIDRSIRVEDTFIISVFDKNGEDLDGMSNEGCAKDAILEVLEWSL